ncbi:MAG: NAD(P)/FAD-dependent oxidoreductase [Actinobacteria bacterium]|nr:NAD(P)/FAD-dependent oxidoreductase [Actinomycetota bacterium]
MEKADVVIVGAGPSGSSIAYFLAELGVDVILIDKSNFPREKICGDGLGPRSIKMLNKIGLSDWLSSSGYYRCDRIRLFSNSGAYFESKIPSEDTPYPHFYITTRADFDQKLVETAAVAGARVFMGCKAIDLVASGGTLKGVRVDNGGIIKEIPCRVVICADGTHGTFTRRTGIKCIKPHALAVRVYCANIKGLDDCINIYLDKRIPEGYAWVFPVSKENANIGVGLSCHMMRRYDIEIKGLLDWFLTEKATYPLDLSSAIMITDVKGAYLRMGYGRHKVLVDGILLAGDAASLVNPLSGEGIAYALESGEIAAYAVKAALDKGDVSSKALASYKDELDRHFLMDHRVYEFLRWLACKPKWMDRAIRKGRENPNFAAKFVSVMMSTARPTSIFSPEMLRCYLGP